MCGKCLRTGLLRTVDVCVCVQEIILWPVRGELFCSDLDVASFCGQFVEFGELF